MHEAFWNGLFDVRWEEAPLGLEAIRLVQRLRERGYPGLTCRDYGHAVVHLGRYLHEELESDRVRDEGVVADFLAGHLPGCRCYRRPAGRQEEPGRRGLAHLLVMLREEGAFPPVTADEPPYRQLIEGYCRFLRHDRGLAETTVAKYRRYLRDFLVSRSAAVSPVELAALALVPTGFHHITLRSLTSPAPALSTRESSAFWSTRTFPARSSGCGSAAMSAWCSARRCPEPPARRSLQ